jgi:hypothetical protein
MNNSPEVTPASLALKEIYDQLVEVGEAISNPFCDEDLLRMFMVLTSGAMLGIAMRGLSGEIPTVPPGKPWKIDKGSITYDE